MHDEVITFFHEFGHIMHGLFNEANFDRFTGTQTELDFVEMPSQMLENWMWDKEILQKVSKHYKWENKIPNDLIEKKLANQNVFTGITNQY
jgi:Zn-dependent oligopeptidase